MGIFICFVFHVYPFRLPVCTGRIPAPSLADFFFEWYFPVREIPFALWQPVAILPVAINCFFTVFVIVYFFFGLGYPITVVIRPEVTYGQQYIAQAIILLICFYMILPLVAGIDIFFFSGLIAIIVIRVPISALWFPRTFFPGSPFDKK